jgi:hypothetical protein
VTTRICCRTRRAARGVLEIVRRIVGFNRFGNAQFVVIDVREVIESTGENDGCRIRSNRLPSATTALSSASVLSLLFASGLHAFVLFNFRWEACE